MNRLNTSRAGGACISDVCTYLWSSDQPPPACVGELCGARKKQVVSLTSLGGFSARHGTIPAWRYLICHRPVSRHTGVAGGCRLAGLRLSVMGHSHGPGLTV